MKDFPLNYKHVAIGSFIAVTILAVIVANFVGAKTAAIFGAMTYIAGMIDFTIMYDSMTKAMKSEVNNSLVIMRKGMFMRFAFALFATVTVIKLDFMPWGILIGLLITHVIMLADSIFFGRKINI